MGSGGLVWQNSHRQLSFDLSDSFDLSEFEGTV